MEPRLKPVHKYIDDRLYIWFIYSICKQWRSDQFGSGAEAGAAVAQGLRIEDLRSSKGSCAVGTGRQIFLFVFRCMSCRIWCTFGQFTMSVSSVSESHCCKSAQLRVYCELNCVCMCVCVCVCVCVCASAASHALVNDNLTVTLMYLCGRVHL